jgi:hypothetical protein
MEWGYKMYKNQLCWDCVNCVPDRNGRGCSWSRKFIPVEGWEAIENGDTYNIIRCPEFIIAPKEDKRKKAHQSKEEKSNQAKEEKQARQVNMIGKTYNSLTAIKLTGKNEYDQQLVECLCSCGAVITANADKVIKGTKRHCGNNVHYTERKKNYERNKADKRLCGIG